MLIRSTAAGERLGGLARATRAAAQALAAAFDVVVIETVGVGQAETEVADVADTVVVVVQPGSGDVLQFLKSGIMETPDVLVVTKSDLGQVATRTRRDLAAALRSLGNRSTRVVAVSSLAPPSGIDELIEAIDEHRGETRPPRTSPAGTASRSTERLRPRAGRAGPAGARRPRAAERLLAEQDPGLEAPALVELLTEAMGAAVRMKIDLLIMFASFVLASALAGALGAANLGTALAFGQIAFAASTVYVMLKR